MRILLVNTSECTGGAAVACRRLLDAFNAVEGVSATMLVRDKQSSRKDVVALPSPRWKQGWHFVWERFVIWAKNGFSRKNLFAVDIANAGDDITQLPEFKAADVIHLHWVNQGMLSLAGIRKILASGKPVVWTMHDMWPCTGICHHARECKSYVDECHDCPYLRFKGENDLSHSIFNKKLKAYGTGGHITFVACSSWLKNLAENSALFGRHYVTNIPNPICLITFRPQDKLEARRRLSLPENEKLILFGAVKTTDKRKGIDYMVEACNLLKCQHPKLSNACRIVVFGRKSEELNAILPFEVHSLGYVADERHMADVYSAVDIYVTPSLEENLPNTIMESLACCTPCVGFNVGGIPEMIDHKMNGYVADYKNAQDFADGIAWVLEEGEGGISREEMRRDVIARFSPQVVARQYITVYENALRIRES